MSIYKGQTELKNMYIGKPSNATQGPAPTGYHIPSEDEREALCGILTDTFGLASNGNTMATYLKMPFAGNRNRSSSSVGNAGSRGVYWSSTAYSTVYAYYLYFDSSSLYPQDGSFRSFGFSLRCFKDSPIIPTSSWTTLYDGSSIATDAGVFRDSTNGLISISGDGQNWITIMDKNLGATSTDTNNTNSYGYYYQWGNNYGFPTTGSVTTSSTKVDASGYGPGNYYSSSTFITTSSSPYDRSSVQNDNLRGGETGTLPYTPIKKVMLGSTQIWPEGWKPGANTLLYLPLESDVVDMSGQATTRVFSTNSLTYTTVDNIPSVHIGSTGGIKLTTPYPLVPKTDTYPCTVSVLVYTTNTNTNRCILDMAATNGNRQNIRFDTANKLSMSVYNDTNDSSYATLQATLTPSQWNHIVYTITTTSSKLYVNGVLVDSGAGNPNYPRGNRPYGHDNTQGIFCIRDSNYTRGLDGNARELIFEKKEWTADEVANYYTWIKSKLGF